MLFARSVREVVNSDGRQYVGSSWLLVLGQGEKLWLEVFADLCGVGI